VQNNNHNNSNNNKIQPENRQYVCLCGNLDEAYYTPSSVMIRACGF
jgi:hypothetical protein